VIYYELHLANMTFINHDNYIIHFNMMF